MIATQAVSILGDVILATLLSFTYWMWYEEKQYVRKLESVIRECKFTISNYNEYRNNIHNAFQLAVDRVVSIVNGQTLLIQALAKGPEHETRPQDEHTS